MMKKAIDIIRKRSDLFFLILLLIIGLFYNYQEIIFKPPFSVHFWRQADCASIAYNYSQHGMSFFKPKMHNLMSDNLTTGYNVGECPLIQYLAAILYKIFGFKDFWYRIIITFFYFTGIFALFKICKLLIVDLFWSCTLSLLFFACPNLVFYGNNFISDIPAFSLSLLSWLYFFKFYFNKNQKHLVISIMLILVASLLKATAGMNLIVIVLIFLFEYFHVVKFNDKIFSKIKIFIFSIIVFFAITISWYLYARYYNQVHQKTDYFLLGIWPIWSLAKEDILDVLNGIVIGIKCTFIFLCYIYY